MTEIIPTNSFQKSKSSPELFDERSSSIRTSQSPRKNFKVKFDSSIFLDDLFKKAYRLSQTSSKTKKSVAKYSEKSRYGIGIDIVSYGAFSAKMAYVTTKRDGSFSSIKIVENHIGSLKCCSNSMMRDNDKEFIEQFHLMISKIFELFGKRWYEITNADLKLPKTAMFKIIEQNQMASISFDEARTYSVNKILTKFFVSMLECIGIDLTNDRLNWSEQINRLSVALPSDFHSYQRLCLKNCFEQIGLGDRFMLVNKSSSLALPFMSKKLNDSSKKFIIDFGSGYMNSSLIKCVDRKKLNVIDQTADRNLSSRKFYEKCYKALKHQANCQNVHIILNRTLTRFDLYTQMNNERTNDLRSENWTIKTQGYEFSLDMKKLGIEELASGVIENLKTNGIIDQNSKINDQITEILVCSDAVLYEYLEPLLKLHSNTNTNIIFMDNDCASIGAAYLSSNSLDLTSNDMLPHKIGMGLYNGVIKNLISSKTSFPCSGKYTFQTLIDNQTILRINLYEGDSPLARYCKHISELVIENIRKAPSGSVKIELKIEMDQNGVLYASAKDVDLRQELPVIVNFESVNCFETIKRSKYALKNIDFTRPDDGSDAVLAKTLQDFDYFFEYLNQNFKNLSLDAQMIVKKKIYLAKRYISKNRLKISNGELEQIKDELQEIINKNIPKYDSYNSYHRTRSNFCSVL